MTTGNFSPAGDAARFFSSGQRVLKRFTLNRLLGQGGMGVVWLARDEDLDRDVALKFVPSLLVNDRTSLNDLKNETKRTLELTHPNIVRTYDFIQDESLAGISMEYMDNDTLRNRKMDQPTGMFECDQLAEWTLQLCNALDYAHQSASIVHRDLKPANLMLNIRNQLKVADFGISRSLMESVTQVTGLTSSGTLLYMSPQQLAGESPHPLDDIYAVGATLYELITTKPPFYSGDITGQVYRKVAPTMAERRASLNLPAGNIPEKWETTVAACLAKDPTARPQSAGEIALRLGLKAESASAIPGNFSVAPQPVKRVEPAQLPGVPPRPIQPAAMAPAAMAPAVPAGKPPGRKTGLLVVCGVGILALAAAGSAFLFYRARPGTGSSATAQSTPAPLPAAPSATPAPVVAVQPAPTPVLNAKGSIFVQTQPAGAAVKVDGMPPEISPVELKGIPVGKHTLAVSLDGYESYTSPLDVNANETTDAGKIQLERSVGWVNVTTQPAGVEITLKGPPDATVAPISHPAPWSSDKLPVGAYEITATRTGFPPVTKEVMLARNSVMPVSFDLTGGSLEIDSTPTGASVSLNGKVVGQTPYQVQDLPPGDIQYSLSHDGYQEGLVKGTIAAGQPLKLVAKLAVIHHVHHHSDDSDDGPVTRRRSDDDSDRSSGSAWDKAGRAMGLFNQFRGY
jgi:hypothetical protein